MVEPKEIHDWMLICVLGAGAFGKVSLWRNKITEEHVAVKKCKFHLPNHLSDRQRQRWINEVEIMKSMNNENIVQYKKLPPALERAFEEYNPSRLPMLPMEYCSKGNLRKFLGQTKNLKGCEESDVRCILKDIANGVSYLHGKNITHRDIKPENIVIQECNSRPSKNIYKLIDLGYAKELETIASFVGTLPYLAPEIFFTQPYNSSVDYWSLGILTYELITGEHPFLPNKTPVERFNYLKKKSDEHISISISRDGTVEFSKEISLDNHLSPVFKKNIEHWLRLLLVYDSNKRGYLNGERMNVFDELETALNKKILRVFSIFNYRNLDYEINDATTLSDLKGLIERDTSIPRELQMFIVDRNSVICDENVKLMDFYLPNNQNSLFVFKRNNDFEARTVKIPQQVQVLFRPVNVASGVLKKHYSQALFFINQEKELMERFNLGLILQIEHTSFLFGVLKKLYADVRCDLQKLITQIECYHTFDEWCGRDAASENEEYLSCLRQNGVYLRQVKELVENFNSLTERFLKVMKLEWLCNHAENLKRALRSSEPDMTNIYEKASILYQKITPSNNSDSTEMMQLLSMVLQIPSKLIFGNLDLKKFLKCALSAQSKLQKLYVWAKAIAGEINRISLLICDCEREKCVLGMTTSTNALFRIPLSLLLRDLEDDVMTTNHLIGENQALRYQIQDATSEYLAYLRNTQKDMIYFWNGIVLPTSQNTE